MLTRLACRGAPTDFIATSAFRGRNTAGASPSAQSQLSGLPRPQLNQTKIFPARVRALICPTSRACDLHSTSQWGEMPPGRRLTLETLQIVLCCEEAAANIGNRGTSADRAIPLRPPPLVLAGCRFHITPRSLEMSLLVWALNGGCLHAAAVRRRSQGLKIDRPQGRLGQKKKRQER